MAEISYDIDRDYRYQSFADMLIKDAIAYAEQHGFKYLLAILLDLNTASLRLLKKHGFRLWGELPGIVGFGDLICRQFIYGKNIPQGPYHLLASQLSCEFFHDKSPDTVIK